MENKEEVVGEEDNFGRLPHELAVSILNKVADLKSLCRCSVVSKHFASLISHVTTIAITLPVESNFAAEHYKIKFKKLYDEAQYISNTEQIPLVTALISLCKNELPIFLEKFRGLESIFLEYKLPITRDASSFLKLMLKWSKSDSRGAFLALIHTRTDYEAVDEQPPNVNDCFWLSYGPLLQRCLTLCLLVKCHSSLRSVIITDSKKQVKLVLRDEQVAEIRSYFPEKERKETETKTVTVVWVPLLHLPLSGCFMRGVCLVMSKFSTESSDDDDDDDMLAWDFEDHEKMYGEAVKEILKKSSEGHDAVFVLV